MILILLGPPGVGKGTQAKLLAKKFHIPHLSTGDILRAAVAARSTLGKKANEYLQHGTLVPDDVMIEVIAEELSQPLYKKGFILDGFPRTLAQAEALETLFQRLNVKLDAVLTLEAEEAELIRRLSRRRMCRNCHSIFNLDLDKLSDTAVCPRCKSKLYLREDDREETIRNRLKVYRRMTAPLRDFYAKRQLLITINGVGAVQKILDDIVFHITKYNEKE